MSGPPADAPVIPTTGDELDGLRIGERIHVGRLGAVYAASSAPGRAPLEYPVIVKTPSPGRIGGEGLLGFQTETRILPALVGANVPRFFAAGDITLRPYLAIERVEGRSLEAIMKGRRLAFDEAALHGAAICDALTSIHGQGVIHLDLKPDNVLIRPSGKAVLIDFGMAHHARLPDLLTEERRHAGGSAPYVSPEQVLGSRADPRSDLFALGVILYEMVTGRLPFGIPRTLAGLRDRLWLDPVPPRLLVPELPRWFQEVTLHCLEPDASRRYQTALEVALDLRHPEEMVLTPRARKIERAGAMEHLRRWWLARSRREAPPTPGSSQASGRAVMVAVDTMHLEDERHPVLRAATARLLASSSASRLICVSVVRSERVAAGAGNDGAAPGIHMEHLVRLRKWVEPLHVDESRLSLHVIEALNPSGTLLEFARHNNVELIVIGAPTPEDHSFSWWRSVASGVTANAHCSVEVVRILKSARP